MSSRPWLLACLAVLCGPVRPTAGQIYRIPPPDTSSGNYFGSSVAVDGERIVAGASGVDSCGPNSGAAYVFAPGDDHTWYLEAELMPDDCEEGDFFGRAVAVDGDRVVVTAYRPYFSTYRSNAVHIFHRDSTGIWAHVQRIDAPGGAREGAFAAAVALSGPRLVVTSAGDAGSAGHDGAAYLYEAGADRQFTLAARLAVPDAGGGGAYGTSCAVEGHVIAVSSSTVSRPGAGVVHVFEPAPDGSWHRTARFGGIEDAFVPMSISGGRLLVGQRHGGRRDTGLATLYEADSLGTWRRTATLRPPRPYPSGGFGSGVALTADRALVVGFDEQLQFDFNIDRVVYVFGGGTGGPWVQRQIIDLGETHFGASVDADGATAVIGAATDGRPGAVYVARLH